MGNLAGYEFQATDVGYGWLATDRTPRKAQHPTERGFRIPGQDTTLRSVSSGALPSFIACAQLGLADSKGADLGAPIFCLWSHRAVEQPDAADERGASDGRSPLI